MSDPLPEMVERVAQAIANARHGLGTWERLNEVERRDFEHQARAALAQISPTIEDGPKAHENGSLTISNADVQRLTDYGLLHYTDEGFYIGEWPKTNTPVAMQAALGEKDA